MLSLFSRAFVRPVGFVRTRSIQGDGSVGWFAHPYLRCAPLALVALGLALSGCAGSSSSQVADESPAAQDQLADLSALVGQGSQDQSTGELSGEPLLLDEEINLALDPLDNQPLGSDAYDIFDVRNPIEFDSRSPLPQIDDTTIDIVDDELITTGGDVIVSVPETYEYPQDSVGTSEVLLNARGGIGGSTVITRPYNHIPGVAQLNVGDSFTFSNPTTSHTVRSITGDSLFWQVDNNDRAVTTHNLLLPAVSWTSEQRGQGSRELFDVQGSLFPLRIGATTSFRVVSTANISPYRWESRWSCSVVNRGIITVIAGEFDTYVVVCGRNQDEEITFYFAPQLGHYVRQEITTRGSNDLYVRELIAYNRPNLGFEDSSIAAQAVHDDRRGVSASAQPSFRSTYTPALPIFQQGDDHDQTHAMPDESAVVLGVSRSHQQQKGSGTSTKHAVLDQASLTYDPRGQGEYRVENGFYAHLASYFNNSTAERGWRILSQRIEGLSNEPRDVAFVRIPDLGEYYRLLVGPFNVRSDVERVCQIVRGAGEYCRTMEIK